METVTFVPVFLAGLASAIIGSIWYSPYVFGTAWARMTGITPEMAERGKRKMWIMAIVGLLASMLVAYVMDYFGIAWQVGDWLGAMQLGFWCWIGFAAPPMLGMVLWEQKPVRLYLINALYWLVAFVVMALVLLYASMWFTPNPYNTQDTGAYVQSE
jgi:hypothetical protein